jgi:NMT1-like family
MRKPLRETAGTTENCKLLRDPNSCVDVSFVTGGFCDNSQTSELLSLGAVYHVPTWIFYSSPEPLGGLSQLKGKRIAVGQEGSGIRDTAERILDRANINSKTATLLPLAGNAAVDALNDGKVDAVFITSIPRAPAIEALLTNPRFRLMDFSTAEAFTRIFPDFVRLVWPKGIVEIDPPNPQNDVTLLGVTAKLIIRGDVHPAIVQLLARTIKEEHGGPGVFQRAGEFPTSVDPEFPISQIAIDYYKNGPPFLQEYLPFWMAIYARRMIALLVATLAIVLPVFGFAPRLYGWFIQEHLRRLYRRLRVVENSLQAGPTASQVEALQNELADIEQATSAVPMRNSDLYFVVREERGFMPI